MNNRTKVFGRDLKQLVAILIGIVTLAAGTVPWLAGYLWAFWCCWFRDGQAAFPRVFERLERAIDGPSRDVQWPSSSR